MTSLIGSEISSPTERFDAPRESLSLVCVPVRSGTRTVYWASSDTFACSPTMSRCCVKAEWNLTLSSPFVPACRFPLWFSTGRSSHNMERRLWPPKRLYEQLAAWDSPSTWPWSDSWRWQIKLATTIPTSRRTCTRHAKRPGPQVSESWAGQMLLKVSAQGMLFNCHNDTNWAP